MTIYYGHNLTLTSFSSAALLTPSLLLSFSPSTTSLAAHLHNLLHSARPLTSPPSLFPSPPSLLYHPASQEPIP